MNAHTPDSGMVTLTITIEQARSLLASLASCVASEFAGADEENPEEVLAAYREAETLAANFHDEEAEEVCDSFGHTEVPLMEQLLRILPSDGARV